LNNRKILEFEDLEKRAENIRNAGGYPKDILVQMQKIADTHPDSIRLKQIIKFYK
jgi:hypothetical protein